MSKDNVDNSTMDTNVTSTIGGDTSIERSDIESITSESYSIGNEGGSDVTGRDFNASADAEKVLCVLEPEVREKFETLAREFRDNNRSSTRKYIADVFLPRSDEFGSQAIGYLAKRVAERRDGFFGFSIDGDHIHIIHDCSYSGRSCRCRFREVLGTLGHIKRNERFLRNCSDIQTADWVRILIYYFFAKRGIKSLSNNGIPVGLYLDSEFVHNRESVRGWSEEFRQEQVIRGVANAYTRQFRNKRSIGETDGAPEEGLHGEESTTERFHGKKSKREPVWDTIRKQIFELLQAWHPAPLQTIRSVEVFKQTSILTNPKNDAYVNKAIQLYSDTLVGYRMRDFYNVLECCPHPIFYKGVLYGNVEESTDILVELMKFQFDDQEERIVNFLQYLIDILDRRIPKRNCLVLYSPPSAGKNFFIDMICAIIVNYGQLGQANRHNLFAFQEAPNKRMLIWNEPNYESSMTDTIKMMFAGDPYNVRVKHSPDTPVTKTPVIVMTNNTCPFMGDPAFKDRIKMFQWKPALFLKDINFKPHPMSFFHLLNKYNIQY